METKRPTPEEIRDAVEYLRGERNMPTSEIELEKEALKKDSSFTGCLGLIFFILFAAGVGALMSGQLGGSAFAMALAIPTLYLILKFREGLWEKKKRIEELKRKEWEGK